MASASSSNIPWSVNPTVRKKRSHLPFSADDFKKGEISFPSPYIVPNLISLNPDKKNPLVVPATDLITMCEMDNPIVIIGNPFVGKTCLFLKLIAESNNFFGLKHWVRMMDLRTAIASYTNKKKPESFYELLADQLRAPMSTVRELFKPIRNAKELANRCRFEKLIRGELFLDGLDEIPAAERYYFLKLIGPLKEKRYECPIRVWISCRTYYKDHLVRLMGPETAWEIQDYDVDLQKNLLFYRWKEQNFGALTKLEESRLWQYTQLVYDDICREIKDFERTLGSAPFYLEIISSIYNEHVRQFMEIYMKAKNKINSSKVSEPSSSNCSSCGPKKSPPKTRKPKKKLEKPPVIHEEKDVAMTSLEILNQLVGLPIMDFLEQLVFTAVDVYCLKYHFDKAISDPDFRNLVNREYHRAISIYAGYAMHTYETGYEFEMFKRGEKGRIEHNTSFILAEDLHNMGFLVVVNGKPDMVQFRNRLLGDFFLGRHIGLLAACLRSDFLYEKFLVRDMLFDPGARSARSFLDKSLVVQDTGFRHDGLRNFLISHYFLSEMAEDNYVRYRNSGSCFHIAVMDGFYKLAMAMLRCFDPILESGLLRRFLLIKVPIEMYEGARSNGQVTLLSGVGPGGRHPVSTLGVIALFGCGSIVEKFLEIYMQVFTHSELQTEFALHDRWTPMHYAAMHSNLWFFMSIYDERFVPKEFQPRPGIFCRRGQLPTHLLMSYCWNHIMIIRERYMKPYDIQGSCDKNCKERGPSCKIHGRDVIGFRMMMKDFDTREGEHLRAVHLECIRKLVVIGKEDVNATEKITGNTMLHYACLAGQHDTVKLLIDLGASVNIPNAEGRVPLHYAAIQGMRGIFLTLMKAGSKGIEEDFDGLTPVSYWFNYGQKVDEMRDGPMTEDEDKFFKTLVEMGKYLEDSEVYANSNETTSSSSSDSDTVDEI